MGCQRICVHNRTHSKAVALASEFGVEAMESLRSSNNAASTSLAASFDVVLCTVPASAGFTLPAGTWTVSPGGGGAVAGPRLVLDAAYRPSETALLRQALTESGGACLRVKGIDMLLMQGYGQLRRWLSMERMIIPLKKNVEKKVRRYYEESGVVVALS